MQLFQPENAIAGATMEHNGLFAFLAIRFGYMAGRS
jgi:hypothetical protein